MISSRIVQRRLASSASCRSAAPSVPRKSLMQRRWMTPAPKPGDGPLMARRADRELPDISQVRFRWGRTLPIFLAVVSVCSVAIFNYQKASSPVISSTLYALRVSDRARALLGDNIYFKHQIPWISGEMNQLGGRIDISFAVRGSRGVATMRFASNRPTSRGLFETTEWSLTTEDGEWVDLLEGGDPFKALVENDGSLPPAAEEATTRGFRQQSTGAVK